MVHNRIHWTPGGDRSWVHVGGLRTEVLRYGTNSQQTGTNRECLVVVHWVLIVRSAGELIGLQDT